MRYLTERLLSIAIVAAGIVIVFGLIALSVQWAWNASLSPIFALPQIDLLQALALLVLLMAVNAPFFATPKK